MKLYSQVVCVALLLGSSLGFSVDIFQAIEQGDKKAIKQWLKSSPDINAFNDQGQTLLIKAVKVKNKSLVKKLLKKSVKVNVLDVIGKTALDYASEMKNVGIIVNLVQHRASVTTDKNLKIVKSVLKQSFILRFVIGLGFIGLSVLFSGCILICSVFDPGRIVLMPAIFYSSGFGLACMISGGCLYKKASKVQIIT